MENTGFVIQENKQNVLLIYFWHRWQGLDYAILHLMGRHKRFFLLRLYVVDAIKKNFIWPIFLKNLTM